MFEVLINGVDYHMTVLREFDISESGQANGQTLNLGLFLRPSGLPAPVGGNVIEFLRDGIREFHGRITSVEQTQPSNNLDLFTEMECVDFTADLDAKLVQGTFPAGNAGDAIRAVVSFVGKGFTTNNVVVGPSIAEIAVDNEEPSSVISRIAQSVEHNWYVDYDRDINFYFIRDRSAPIGFLDLDTDAANYFDATISESVDQVKNVIYLTGAKAKSTNPVSQTFTGDGKTRFFPLMYEPWDMDSVTLTRDPENVYGQHKVYTLKLDGTASTPGDGNTDADTAFVCLDNWGIRLPDGIDAPGSDDDADPDFHIPFQADYNSAYDPVTVVEDPNSIELMRQREDTIEAPSDGRHEFKYQLPEMRVDNEDALYEYGQLLLSRYAMPRRSISMGSWTQGWSVGQHLEVVSAKRGLPLTTFYVEEVKKSLLKHIGEYKFRYEITLSDSPFPG